MVIKNLRAIASILIVTLYTTNAMSASNEYLPHSDHYQGQAYFDDFGYKGHIEFAVYDTETNPDQFVGRDGFDQSPSLDWWTASAADNSRFIYAYQIFLDNISSEVIEYFGLLGVAEGAIVRDESTNNEWPIDAVNDASGDGV